MNTPSPARPLHSLAITFFATHAGYSTPPGRLACAKALAFAEARARVLELEVRWEDEGNPGMSWWAHVPDPENPRQSLASLCGITIRPDDHNYRRVVEAELFAEAIHAIPNAE